MLFTRSFTSCETLIILYESLVRSGLMFCSIIWTPYNLNNILMIQYVHYGFLRHLAFNSGPVSYIDHYYNSISRKFNKSPVKSIDHLNYVFITHKIVNRNNCNELSDVFRTTHH